MNAVKKPHKHAEVIKAWADGEQIEAKFAEGAEWLDVKFGISWNEDYEYRVKPREFPKSNLSAGSLCKIWTEAQVEYGVACNSLSKTLARVADEAVKQYVLDSERESATRGE